MRSNRWVIATVIAVASLTGCSISIQTGTTPAPVSAAETPAPVRASEPSPSISSRTPAPRAQKGSSATFEHFKVTVRRVSYRGSAEALVLAEVCVRSLPPDPQGDRTRISWDPWSVTAGTRTVSAGFAGSKPQGMFAADKTYRVGSCVRGWIPFQISGHLDTIRYANGVGNKAIWAADDLSRKPVSRTSSMAKSSATGIGEGTFLVGRDIEPGRYESRAKAGGLCYWARLRDDSGELDSIIANNATSGHASVTIRSGDEAFETSGCAAWIRR